MSSLPYRHGIRIVREPGTPRPLRLGDAGVIGAVGTAPSGPVDTPTLVRTEAEAAAFGSGLGSLPPFLSAILSKAAAKIVVINRLDPATHKVAVAEADHTFGADATLFLHTNIRDVVVKSSDGATTYDAGDDYTVDEASGVVTRHVGGDIAAGATVKIKYDRLDASQVTDADLAGTSANGDGAHALPGAGASGAVPKLLCAPGASHDAANVRPALLAAAESLLGIAILEGPDTTDAAAIADAATLSDKRAFLVDPSIIVPSGDTTANIPASAAGCLGFLAGDDPDAGGGAWRSPSNKRLPGVLGTRRDIGISISGPSAANDLNAANVNTVVNLRGWRLWGGRTCSADGQFRQVNVVRTDDLIQEAIVDGHLEAVDAGIERDYLQFVADRVSATLRRMRQDGAIIDGKCWVDPDRNTPESIAAGNAVWAYDFAPVYAAETLTFYVAINDGYLTQIVDAA